MEYFRINETNLSPYISGLKISYKTNYNAQTNAAGDMVVDIVNKKKVFDVTFTYMNYGSLRSIIDDFYKEPSVTVYYLDPDTGETSYTQCFVAGFDIDYYTISRLIITKPFTVQFIEL